MITRVRTDLPEGAMKKLNEWYPAKTFRLVNVWIEDETCYCVIRGEGYEIICARIFPVGQSWDISVDCKD